MIDFRKMNPAEQRLGMGFGALLLLLVHLFGLRFIGQQSHRLSEELELRRAEQEMVNSLLQESALWEPRAEWMSRHLPAKTPDTKKVLDEKVESVGKQFSLNPSRGQTLEEIGEFYDAEQYPASLAGRWPDLIKGFQKLYLPEEGIAITSVEIKAVDEKTHSAAVTISRFFLHKDPGESP